MVGCGGLVGVPLSTHPTRSRVVTARVSSLRPSSCSLLLRLLPCCPQAAALEQASRPFKIVLFEMTPVNVMVHPAATEVKERRTNHRIRLWNSILRRAWMNASAEAELALGVTAEHDSTYLRKVGPVSGSDLESALADTQTAGTSVSTSESSPLAQPEADGLFFANSSRYVCVQWGGGGGRGGGGGGPGCWWNDSR